MVCKDPKFYIINTMKEMKEALEKKDLKTYNQLKRRMATITRAMKIPINLDAV